MLAETRAELDDFHQASKELEAELENELQRTEKAQRELQAKVSRAENERDEWKVCISPELMLCQFILSSDQVYVSSNDAQYYHDFPSTRTRSTQARIPEDKGIHT
jgi:hypothetical protein